MQEVIDLIRWHQEWERQKGLTGPFLKILSDDRSETQTVA